MPQIAAKLMAQRSRLQSECAQFGSRLKEYRRMTTAAAGAALVVIALLLWPTGPVLGQDIKPQAGHAVESGWSYLNRGDMDTALRRFRQALVLDPNFAPAYFGIAYMYSVQNKLDLAIENYGKSIEKDPSFSHAYSNLGLALVAQRRFQEALPMLEKALAIDPKNGDAHVNVAVYYFETADYQNAWTHVHLAQNNGAAVRPEFLRDLKLKMPEPRRPGRERSEP